MYRMVVFCSEFRMCGVRMSLMKSDIMVCDTMRTTRKLYLYGVSTDTCMNVSSLRGPNAMKLLFEKTPISTMMSPTTHSQATMSVDRNRKSLYTHVVMPHIAPCCCASAYIRALARRLLNR